jgi:replicative DNA helicase
MSSMTDEKLDPRDTFSGMGSGYQERVLQAMIQDPLFADQMFDILDPRFFDMDFLQVLTLKFFDHKRKYKTFPSAEVLDVMTTKDSDLKPEVVTKIREYIKKINDKPLNGDAPYIQDSSLDFCKKQKMKGAIMEVIDKLEASKFDDITPIIRNALAVGSARDIGHEYSEGFEKRAQRSIRRPMKTGWTALDKALNGGWERGTLSTFIAPTGAGKSMFLVNAAAAACEAGLNVVYITLEMADFKIGLRFDSYYSGVAINDIPDHASKVETTAKEKAKGRLIIKEFATKTASVQTIRSYLQRLQATKNFIPDFIAVDYADLLRGARGYADKRFELEGNYEELRAMAQEFGMVVITADQTNRSGLDMEVVSIAQIGESYAKATVCDLIMTVSRTMEDKQKGTGRLFIAKSRLGSDGMIYPFLMNPATVKVRLLEHTESLDDILERETQKTKERLGDHLDKIMKKKTGND